MINKKYVVDKFDRLVDDFLYYYAIDMLSDEEIRIKLNEIFTNLPPLDDIPYGYAVIDVLREVYILECTNEIVPDDKHIKEKAVFLAQLRMRNKILKGLKAKIKLYGSD